MLLHIVLTLFSYASSKARAFGAELQAHAQARPYLWILRKLVLELELKQKIRASSCSSSNFLYGSSKLELKLKCFIWFRASSSSSSNFLYGFEQARARAQMFYMVSSKLKLELDLFVWFRASSSSSSNFFFGARYSLIVESSSIGSSTVVQSYLI